MANGDDAKSLAKQQHEQAVQRMRVWNEGVQSDHDHAPLIDGMESVMTVSEIIMNRMNQHGELLDQMATKADIEHMAASLNGRKGGSVRNKKIDILRGLFKFEGFSMRDIMALLLVIGGLVGLYLLFDVKEHLSHMGNGVSTEEPLTTEEME